MSAIRGAITCANTQESIKEAVELLMKDIFDKNNLCEKEVDAVIFSVTSDLNKFNAATAFRLMGYASIPLFSCVEPKIKGGLKRCIRVMLFVEGKEKSKIKHVYLREAKNLRGDLND